MADAATFRVTDWGEMNRAVDPLVASAASSIADTARARTPRRSGTLAAGWRIQRTVEGRYIVINDVPYGRFVEYGTRRNNAAAMLGQATANARAAYGSR